MLNWTGPDRVRWAGRIWLIRRLMYELCVGRVPPGHVCCSVCNGAPYCVEATHLETRARPKPGISAAAAVFCDAADRVIAEEMARLQWAGAPAATTQK